MTSDITITGLTNSTTRVMDSTSSSTLSRLRGANRVEGTAGDDELNGTLGDDVIIGDAGNDTLMGFSGNDIFDAGDGDDIISGGAGNDILHIGSGADIVLADAGTSGEGNDVIRDFTVGEDTIEFGVTSLLAAASQFALQEPAAPTPTPTPTPTPLPTEPGQPGAPSADDDDQPQAPGQPAQPGQGDDSLTLNLDDLDNADGFSITESADSFVTINHPGGSVELEGVEFSEQTDSFAELTDSIVIVDDRPEGSQVLRGEDDVEEDISGGIGDDVMLGGTGSDNFLLNPNNADDGNDIFADFDPAEDVIGAEIANLEAADPSLAGASEDGDPDTIELADLDASDNFFLFAASDNSLVIGHPNGTTKVNGVTFDIDRDSFAELEDFFELRDTIDEPTPEEEAVTGFIVSTTPEPGAPTPVPGAPTPVPGEPTPAPGAPTPNLGDPTSAPPAGPALGAPSGPDIAFNPPTVIPPATTPETI